MRADVANTVRCVSGRYHDPCVNSLRKCASALSALNAYCTDALVVVARKQRQLHRHLPRTDERLAIGQEGVLPRAILRLDDFEADVTAGSKQIAMGDSRRSEKGRFADAALHRRRESERSADGQIFPFF